MMKRSRTMSKKIKVDASFWKDSIDKSYQKMVPTDRKDAFVDGLIESIQKKEAAGENKAKVDNIADFAEKRKERPKTRARKTYKTVMATAACAAICGVALMGGFMEVWEPEVQNTNPGIQSTTQTPNDSGTTTEENIVTPTKETIEYKQNDKSQIKKGKINLTGGEQKTNYTNPTKITLSAKNLKNGTCKWTISSENNKTIYTGKTLTITNELNKMLKGKKDGKYIVSYTYKDNDGNEITLYKGFEIETAEPTE